MKIKLRILLFVLSGALFFGLGAASVDFAEQFRDAAAHERQLARSFAGNQPIAQAYLNGYADGLDSAANSLDPQP